MDVLSSQFQFDRETHNTFTEHKKEKTRLHTIVMMINVSTIHLYVGSLQSLNQPDFHFKIFNNCPNLTNMAAERKSPERHVMSINDF